MDAPERTLSVTRAAMRFCILRGWAPVEQVPLPDGRRADILALLPGGDFAILEVKSCARDYLTDAKWEDYRAWCDRLFFAVDLDFPQALLPADAGLLVAEDREAALLRDAPEHRLAPARRRALLHRVALLAAGRLAAIIDPAGAAEMRAALRLE
ncbi:MmcB family DNA repair protein [Roseomonas rosulenta]|uniref:MmcB family DNA repair protein n=1 Tax=Roseomonas rosulenta TaxID=2748667 RepID=UPI0018E04FCA|nr:MmcB family DNA repair protein [Roseomonas rosulenta]